jgi:hypothetical protein
VTCKRNVFCRFFRVAKAGKLGLARLFSKEGKIVSTLRLTERAMLGALLVGLFEAAVQLSVLAEAKPDSDLPR